MPVWGEFLTWPHFLLAFNFQKQLFLFSKAVIFIFKRQLFLFFKRQLFLFFKSSYFYSQKQLLLFSKALLFIFKNSVFLLSTALLSYYLQRQFDCYFQEQLREMQNSMPGHNLAFLLCLFGDCFNTSCKNI